MIEILEGTHETVDYSESIGIKLYLNKETDDYPIHWHTAGEIIMPIENIYTVEAGNKCNTLNPYEIIILPPGELHRIYAPKSGSRIIFQFDCSLLHKLTAFDTAFYLFHPCTTLSPDNLKNIHGILVEDLMKINDEYFSDSPFKEGAIYSLLLHFFVTLGRNSITENDVFQENQSKKQREYIDKMLLICDYIKEHCTEMVKAEDLAEIAGFSKFHFIRLFKQFTGITYYEYLNNHRIMYAEKLLINPDYSITDVAMMSGFNSLSTFNRLFKETKKCTPSQYKKQFSI